MSADGCLVIFAKTPGYSPVKTRLAASIGETAAVLFYEAAVSAIEALAVEATERLEVEPIWAVAEPEALGDQRWSRFLAVSQGGGALGERLDHVYRTVRQDHEFAIFIGADAPHLPLSLLGEAARLMRESASPFAISRADDGGYVLFAGRNDIPAKVWLDVPYSELATAKRFVAGLTPLGPIAELAPQFDVDDLETLARLAETDGSSLLPAQQNAIRQARSLVS